LPFITGIISHFSSKEKKKESENRLTDNGINSSAVHNSDNLHVKFNPKNMKMLYVIHSENCFYRTGALGRAKKVTSKQNLYTKVLTFFLQSHMKVSRRKTSDFDAWHRGWQGQHVAEAQRTNVEEWFMGRCEGLVANETIKVAKTDVASTPYRLYHKYRAEVEANTGTQQPASDES